MRKRNVAILAIGLALASARANASPVLVGYPPNGGVTLGQTGISGTGNGNIGLPDAGIGRTNTYTGFNPILGGYSDLWWGPNALSGPLASPAGPGGGSSQPFTLQSIVGNEAIFTGANNWTIATASGVVSAPVRVELKTFTTAGAPIALTTAGSVPGLIGSLGVVLDVTPYLASGFKADFVFQADAGGGNWIGVDDYFTGFNTLCTGANCVTKSFNGAFWQDATTNSAAVPEPASLVLFGTGVLAIGRRVHTARRRA